MSASLVGSEMCIRDSPWPMGVLGGLRRIARVRLGGWRRLLAWADISAPVSYTHLTLPTICSV
eukprot:6865291-Alexandrium_andersonii.AAC.1